MKPLACWIGRHEWTSRVDEGERYKVCARCGKEPRGRRGVLSREDIELQGGGQGGDPSGAGGTGSAAP